MFNRRNKRPIVRRPLFENTPYGNNQYGGNAPYAGAYPYQQQQMMYGGYVNTQAGSLISKVMGMLAFSFLFAAAGAFVGITLKFGFLASLLFSLLGLGILIALNFLVHKQGLNLFLLYLFAFVQGLGIAALIGFYLAAAPNILMQAFFLTALTSLGLGIYAWTTKRDFSRLGDFLFAGLILLLIASIFFIFFKSTIFALVISVAGIAIFSGYVLYEVQQAKYVPDTLPNAILITVGIFITVLNLFQYILMFLSILNSDD